uniref:Insulinase family protein n=1 Tax=Desulfobacca acetoxidans TaxID=60893 RepID=A0A7C3WIE7_9BACT
MYQKSILPNGIRIVTEELPHFHSVAVGFWLMVGSRDERQEEQGLSHFLEHMAFKGTIRRDALTIAREADQLGGTVNAFTTKENTCFHARVLAEHLPRIIDLLSDLVLNPLYRAEDLERERQVILEEIAAQDDNPEDLVQVQFARHFWKDNPFGWSILGEVEAVSRFRREDLLAYRRTAYRPERLVVAAAGRLTHQELVDLVGPTLENFTNGTPARPRVPVDTHPGVYVLPRDLEQVHVCLGTEGLAADDGRRFTATVLNIILGGNMSSRLVQVVREQLGLAYSIYSFLGFFSDTGILEVCAGVNPKNLPALLEAIRGELRRMKAEPVTSLELKDAQDYLKGSIYLHAEDVEQRMLRLAKNEIHFGRYIPLEEVIEGLLKVTPEDIQTLARELFQGGNWGLALLGPLNGQGSVLLDF